jgi:hypothetical protein
MGGHFSKPNEIFAENKYWRHLQLQESPTLVTPKTWMKSHFQTLKCSRVWHAEQSEIGLWGVISQNPTRYSQKTNIDVICSCKSRQHLLLPKLEWNLTFKHWNAVESDMLNNLRFAYGGSFLKTHRDIRRNQILTKFVVENIATTRLSQNMDEISLSNTEMQ